jgi:hypothetical protein
MKFNTSRQCFSLLGCLLLLAGSALAQAPEKPDLQGIYVLETVTPCKAIREKIESAVKGMPKDKDKARELLIDGNLPAPRLIKISYTLREATISSLPSGPMTTPLDGKYVKARRESKYIEIRTKWKNCKPGSKDCELERTFRNKIGQRINAYSLRADGKLVMQVTAEARSKIKRQFGGSVKYELVYSRTAADDQDLAYEKYPDCQEYNQQRGRIVIIDAATRAKNMLTEQFGSLRARKGYDPQEIIRVVQNSKQSFLNDLAERQGNGGLRAYMETIVTVPTVSELADPESGLASEETLERYKKEKVEQFDLAIANAEPFGVYVSSDPTGATFELLSVLGNDSWLITTDGPLPSVVKGFYRYKLRKAGYKEVAAPFPILLEGKIKRLDCTLVQETLRQTLLPCNLRMTQ